MHDMYEPLRKLGDQMRRKVAGETYVSSASKAAVNFGADFQNVVTAFAWGGVWSRDGLSLRDRSLVTIAVLAALHRPEELKLHMHGGVRNGLTKNEIEEALIQVGVYAGFPATVAGNRVGQVVFGASDAADAESKKT
jgi:4-carboxymuconolactone decarboxylase